MGRGFLSFSFSFYLWTANCFSAICWTTTFFSLRWPYIGISCHFLELPTYKVLYNHLNIFLCNNHMAQMSSICPYLDEGFETWRYVVIYLGSEQSHLKTSKVNVLVILGTCSDISLNQNNKNMLPQNQRKKASLIRVVLVNFCVFWTLNLNSAQISDLCDFQRTLLTLS